MLVVAVNDVVAFFDFVDEFKAFAGGGLAVIIKADDVVAGGLAVACHQGAVLPEVLGEANTLDVIVGGCESFDDLPHVVGAAVVYKDDFVVGVGACGDGFADFLHHGFDGVFAAVTGNDE